MIPDKLQDLLQADNELNRAVGEYLAPIKKILSDNKLPFFPDYTDHGTDHVSAVLATEGRLIPEALWASGLLSPQDAGVIILATALHDLAMHLRESAFLAIVGGEWPDRSRSEPDAFGFKDRPWAEEWHHFTIEAKRFDDATLTRLLGTKPTSTDTNASPDSDWGYRELQGDPSSWNKYQLLFIGEFVRRHHGRLAYEFALFGFPALTTQEFPTLPSILPPANPELGSIAGLVARSHRMSLRRAADVLSQGFPGRPQPAHCVPIYHMALLRVADYLQITTQRAPAILLNLRHAVSRQSVEEWSKHRAVRDIDWEHDDPQALHVTVDEGHGLRTHLQLRELFQGIQNEMDQSAAVLAETYGARGHKYEWLRLDKARLHTSFDNQHFLDSLQFEPRRVAFTTASPEMLKLLITPLYGDYPEVGIRELMQNAIDAVRELRAYLDHHPELKARAAATIDEPEVRVNLDKDEHDQWWCTIHDHGIGMTSETVCRYFLRAGASLRTSDSWKEEFGAHEGVSGVLRSGRFGVGALATFLLGEELEVETRHISEDRGLLFRARIDDELICLNRVDRSVGTTIRIRLARPWRGGRSRGLKDGLAKPLSKWNERGENDRARKSWDWYCGTDVAVERRLENEVLVQEFAVPSRSDPLPNGWRRVQIDGVDDVQWTYSNSAPHVSVNGIQIGAPNAIGRIPFEAWEFGDPREHRNMSPPHVSIFDSEGRVPLDLQRYRCGAGWNEEFVRPIREDIERDFVAYCLVHAPAAPWEAATRKFPLYEKAHSKWPYEPIHNLEVGVPTSWGYCKQGSFHSGAIPLMRSRSVFVPMMGGNPTTARSIELELAGGHHVVLGDMMVGEEWIQGGWREAWFAGNVRAVRLLIAPAQVGIVNRAGLQHKLTQGRWNAITSDGASVYESRDLVVFDALEPNSGWTGIVVELQVGDRRKGREQDLEWRALATEKHLGDDPVIPYNDVERKKKFQQAYAKLSAHIDTWENERIK